MKFCIRICRRFFDFVLLFVCLFLLLLFLRLCRTRVASASRLSLDYDGAELRALVKRPDLLIKPRELLAVKEKEVLLLLDVFVLTPRPGTLTTNKIGFFFSFLKETE